MQNHFTVANTNLTNYIVDGSYNVNSVDSYESWEDGNRLEHRVIITKKIEGSFDIGCSNRSGGLTVARFLELWNSAVNNGVVTLGLFVPSLNQFKALNCYYTIKSKSHILSGDGSFIDVLTISVKER